MDSLGSHKSKAVREAMRSVGAAAVPARLLARSEHNRAGLCQAQDALLRKAKPHLANEIASKANPVPEEVAGVLTWGADEHLILGCAAAAWIALTISRSPLRPASSHLLLVAAASAALPHGLKLVFDQVRPDRKTLRVISRASRCPETASTHFRRAMRFIWARSLRPPQCFLHDTGYRSGALQLACPRRELRF